MLTHYILVFIVWGQTFAVSRTYDQFQPKPPHLVECPGGWPMVVFNVTEGNGLLLVRRQNDVPSGQFMFQSVPKGGVATLCAPQTDLTLSWQSEVSR